MFFWKYGMTTDHLKAVKLEHFYRLINHGPTTMISTKYDGIENVMSASWVCALDYTPTAKLTVVIDKSAFTRTLIEKSGLFAVQIPFAYQADTVMAMGKSRYQYPNKLADNAMALFYQEHWDIPLVVGCAGYILCRLIDEPHNQQAHDLFIGEVLASYADDRVFVAGHWQFDQVADELKTLHYIAGGQFYRIGKGLQVDG